MPLSRLSSVVRAFVVQFYADTNVTEGRLAGRAEHVRTGAVAQFETLQELLRFVQERIEADRADV
jgi:hypothetical protein